MSYLCYLYLFAYSGVHYTVPLIETSSVANCIMEPDENICEVTSLP
jgi:hypothetical protein